MCGIAGYSGNHEPQVLEKCVKLLNHRGPDSHGTFVSEDKRTGLAHTRLSIIDLSEAGAQPMSTPDGRHTLVYNGELYNAPELRKRLEDCGHVFRGHSDTEVVLHCLLEFGTPAIDMFNGIFAFAFHNGVANELLIARDAFGVKPLYLSEGPNGVAFSSEIRPLVHAFGVSKELSPEAVLRYGTYLWDAGRSTLLKQVQQVLPGEWVRVQGGKVIERQSYSFPDYTQKATFESDAQAIEALRSSLEAAVERQMLSDVEVGAFLSGGLDSSAIVGLAAKHTESLKCFTIDFPGSSLASEGFEEDISYAKHCAESFGQPLNVVRVTPEDFAQAYEESRSFDLPSPDPAALNVYLISKLAREMGLKVLLSGAGADDVLTGYRRHIAASKFGMLSQFPSSLWNLAHRVAQSPSISEKTLARRIRRLSTPLGPRADHRVPSLFFWHDPATVSQLFKTPFGETMMDQVLAPFSESASLCPSFEKHSDLEKTLLFEIRHFLADHNLIYTDKMGMKASVEIRVPFLDREFCRLVMSLPEKMLLRGTTTKWVLRKAMEGIVPEKTLTRSKTGFGLPLREWGKGVLQAQLEAGLSEDLTRRIGLFSPEKVRSLAQGDGVFRSGDHTYLRFGVASLQSWWAQL